MDMAQSAAAVDGGAPRRPPPSFGETLTCDANGHYGAPRDATVD
jgi:hypothetical protein